MLPITDGSDGSAGSTLVDLVTRQKIEEVSQEYLRETIIDCTYLTEDQAIQLFDSENSYLKSWPKEKKINYIKTRKEVTE